MYSMRRLLLAVLLTASIIFAPACSNLPTEPNLQDELPAPVPTEQEESFKASKSEGDARLDDLEADDSLEQLGVTRVY